MSTCDVSLAETDVSHAVCASSYIFDLCLLANATLEVIVEDEGVEEVELDVAGDVSEPLDAKKKHVTAEMDEGTTAEKAKPELTMLGYDVRVCSGVGYR